MRNKQKQVLSPITGSPNVKLTEQIQSKLLIDSYLNKFDIDISYLFESVSVVSIYKCLDTGYSFYYPFNIAGDDKFYAHFGKYNWYYLPWKWEHEQCVAFVNEGYRLLEVGAGKGDFLSNLAKIKKVNVFGLELNKEAVALTKGQNINLVNQKVEDFSIKNKEKFDIVCSFQVLEHIPNVGEVLHAMIECLKPQGKLIISVPNNDSFIGENMLPSRILNMPPHHVGLWNEESLRNISKYFPVSCLEIKTESLQEIHLDTYQYNKIRKLFYNNRYLISAYWKLKLNVVMRPFIKLFADKILGHSIIAVFEKNRIKVV